MPIKVLLVDDTIFYRKVIGDILKSYVVYIAPGGKQMKIAANPGNHGKVKSLTMLRKTTVNPQPIIFFVPLPASTKREPPVSL